MEANKPNLDPDLRLLCEACTQMGWSLTDPNKLVQELKRLNLGLSTEDEFSLLISWMGKCKLVHKLDQDQSPPLSKKEFQVPDLFALFQNGDRTVPVLIEVKKSKDRNPPGLSWRPDYLNHLKKYAAMLNLPLLIAWKWETARIWVLFEIRHLQLAVTNYNISFEKAQTENLLSQLAGDFAITFAPNVGFHLLFDKKKKLDLAKDSDMSIEKWLVTVRDAYFTNGKAERVETLGAGLWAMLLCADLEQMVEAGRSEVKQSFVVTENTGTQFAHRMLPILVQYREGQDKPLIWRKIRSEYSVPIEFGKLRESAMNSFDNHIVKYVFDIVPNTKPDFPLD